MTEQATDWIPLHYERDARDDCGGEWMPAELVSDVFLSSICDVLVLLDVIAPQPESTPCYSHEVRCRTLNAARGGLR